MTEPDLSMDLPDLLDEVWRRLEAREGAARNPVLATVGASGPEVRTIVLRAADRQAATLEMHTDAATPKVAQLRRQPRASLLVWDADAALQIRLDARISIRSGASAHDVWAKVPDAARTRYGGRVPGTPIPGPDGDEGTADPERFALLRAYVYRLDVLQLGAARNRRAVYAVEDGFAGRWVAP